MQRIRFTGACLAMGFMLSSTALATNKLFAVLPLDVRMTTGQMSEAARASIEEMMRDEAANFLSRAGWTILTGETTLQVLSDNGVNAGKCSDQGCHLSLAREINTDKFISGCVQYADGEFTASIRLIDTRSGRILSTEHVSGKSAKELREALEPKANDFFTRAGLVELPATAAAPTPAAGPEIAASTSAQGSLRVETTPPGATVSIDGSQMGSTPFEKQLPVGNYDVGLDLEGYIPVWKPVVVENDREAAFSARLRPQKMFVKVLDQGYIDVEAHPSEARITIDGQPAATGRRGPFAAGRHVVRADAEGCLPNQQIVVVADGTTTPAKLELEHSNGALMVSSNIDAECEAQGSQVQVSPLHTERLEVEPGEVRVTCRREGYRNMTRYVNIEPGELVFIAMTLVPLETADARAVDDGMPPGLEIVVHPADPEPAAPVARHHEIPILTENDPPIASTETSDWRRSEPTSDLGQLEIRPPTLSWNVPPSEPVSAESAPPAWGRPATPPSAPTITWSQPPAPTRAAATVVVDPWAAPADGANVARTDPRSGLEFVWLRSSGASCSSEDVFCNAEATLGTNSRATAVKAMWMSRTTVTTNAYVRCMRAGGCRAPAPTARCDWRRGAPGQPMTCIDWTDAKAFCSWIGGRLPDLQEWEHAATVDGGSPGGAATALQTALPSGPGHLLRMADHLWEWTASETGASKVVETLAGRGGPAELESPTHRFTTPVFQDQSVGFRCGR